MRRILELNPDHPVMAALRRRHAADPAAPVVAEYAELLFGRRCCRGRQLPDPAAFARRVAELMARAAE